jgi:hypothetical protein
VPVDRDYKKMMLWLAAAFVATVVAAIVIVELVMRYFAEQ